MMLDELFTALGRLGDGDWQIADIRAVEEAGESGSAGVGAAPSRGRRRPTTTPRRPRIRLRRKNVDELVVKIRLRIN